MGQNGALHGRDACLAITASKAATGVASYEVGGVHLRASSRHGRFGAVSSARAARGGVVVQRAREVRRDLRAERRVSMRTLAGLRAPAAHLLLDGVDAECELEYTQQQQGEHGVVDHEHQRA